MHNNRCREATVLSMAPVTGYFWAAMRATKAA